jgi:solute carrier family 30 (zinc transporter), member 2
MENNKKALRKLVWVILITFIFVFVEICGGLMSNSIAILSDAAHLTSDAFGIAISIVALKIAENKSNDRHTFGYHRAEVLGALVSILFIWAVTIWLMIEATKRLWNPKAIDSELMLIVSGICLIFNLVQMSILHSKDMHDFAHAPGTSCGHDHSHGDHHHGHDHDHDHDHDHHHHDHTTECTGHGHQHTEDDKLVEEV